MPVPKEFEGAVNRHIVVFTFVFNMAAGVGNVDIVTEFVPGFVGSITKFYWIQGTPCTTVDKLGTYNIEINTVNLVGGVISLTSVAATTNTTPLGKVVESTAITGSSSFNKTDTISIESSSVTDFVEGDGMFVIECAQDITV